MRIAVVGAGITGLSAAWLLSGEHDVTLIEASDRVGGHSNTVEASWPDGGSGPVDTGFIVYNTACYPNLVALFEHLGVKTARTSMSFAVSLADGRYEYSGSGARGLFGQPSNLLRPAHWRMASDILRFFREARALAAADGVPGERGPSLGDWLAARRYSAAFVDRHILPMGSAIWSTPSREVLAFPATAFVRFFSNHGLLQVRNRPEWRTVAGGSREYVMRILRAFGGRILTGDPVVAVARRPGEVVVAGRSGARAAFDACLLACPADAALELIAADADPDERRLLGAFRYAANRAVLHRDPSHMPRRRRLWSSWNYLGRADGALAVSYWMNRLQPLTTDADHFVTLNPTHPVAPEATLAAFDYRHPMFDGRAIAAQRELWSLQGRRRTWFAGSYFGWGFHEDGLQAGLAAAEAMGAVRRPWTVTGHASRIVVGRDGRDGGAGSLVAA